MLPLSFVNSNEIHWHIYIVIISRTSPLINTWILTTLRIYISPHLPTYNTNVFCRLDVNRLRTSLRGPGTFFFALTSSKTTQRIIFYEFFFNGASCKKSGYHQLWLYTSFHLFFPSSAATIFFFKYCVAWSQLIMADICIIIIREAQTFRGTHTVDCLLSLAYINDGKLWVAS